MTHKIRGGAYEWNGWFVTVEHQPRSLAISNAPLVKGDPLTSKPEPPDEDDALRCANQFFGGTDGVARGMVVVPSPIGSNVLHVIDAT